MALNDGSDSIEGLRTAEATARLLAISRRHLWDITSAGELPVIRIGRAVRYSVKDINDFIAKSRTKGE